MKWLKNNLHLLLLFIAILIFFYPVWLKGLIPIAADTISGLYHPFIDYFKGQYPSGVPFKNFLLTDPVRQLFLYKQLAIQQLFSGHLPLWNPYSFSGTPLLASLQAGVFYPLNLIFLIKPFINAWTIFIVLQPLLGGWFFYTFCKNLKLDSRANLLGSLSFIFGGFFIAWLEWGNIGHTILWLPLLLLSVDKIIANKKHWGAIFTIGLISQFFAGHLQTSFYVSLLTLAYTIYRVHKIPQASKFKKITFQFASYYLLFALVTAIQWLPTFQFINLSARTFDQTQTFTRPDWFIPFKHLVQFIAPDFFGNPATLNYWGTWNYSEFVGYIGIVPLIFALASIFTIKKSPTKFFTLIALIALLISLPTPLAKLPFIYSFPFISQAQPSRLLSLICFSLSVLASMGLDSYIKKPNKKPFTISVSLLFVTATLWLVASKYISPQNQLVAQRNLILPTGILGLSAFILFFKFKNKLFVYGSLTLLLLLSAFDLLRFGLKYTPFSSKQFLFPQTETIQFLKSDPEVFRIMSTDRRIMPPNFSLAFDLQTIEGYDPLYLLEYANLITLLETGQSQSQPIAFNRIVKPTNIDSDLINQLNVKYVLSLNKLQSPQFKLVFQEDQTHVYQNLKVMPRARIIKGEGSVNLIEYKPEQILLEVNAETDATLELAEMDYPIWHASIDSQPTQIQTNEYNFRHLLVPKGVHQVKFFTKVFK